MNKSLVELKYLGDTVEWAQSSPGLVADQQVEGKIQFPILDTCLQQLHHLTYIYIILFIVLIINIETPTLLRDHLFDI